MSTFVQQGTLLLSAPDLLDPSFMHSVVLLVEHNAEGAFGFVVNRPLETRVSDVLPSHELLGAVDAPLWSGGPVGTQMLQVAHRIPDDRAPGSANGSELVPGVRLGGDLDVIGRILGAEGASESLVRFFVGYSGWGAGQLESEIAEDSWIPLMATPDLVFAEDDTEALWRRALRRVERGGDTLASLPPDPSWN